MSDDFGTKSLEEFVERWKTNEQQAWAIYRGDEIGGVITFRAPGISGAHSVVTHLA